MVMPDNEQEQLTKLLDLVQEALREDEQLRQKYKIGEKFRFVRDRLQGLLAEVQEGPSVKRHKKKQVKTVEVEKDECLVFVHLYNAHVQNESIKAWQHIVTPKAFFDYSVNRPIYKEKADIEEFIKAKANQAQHGYLTVAVKKELVRQNDNLKDAMEHPLVKIKEGALRCERLLSFTHSGQEYTLSEAGELIKKEA